MNLFWACCISGVREATRGKCWSAAQLSTQVFGSYYLVHFQFSGSHLPGFFWPSLFCHLSANRQPLSCPWCFPLAPAHRMWERHFRLRGTRSGTQCAGAPVRSGWSARRGGAWGRVGASRPRPPRFWVCRPMFPRGGPSAPRARRSVRPTTCTGRPSGCRLRAGLRTRGALAFYSWSFGFLTVYAFLLK